MVSARALAAADAPRGYRFRLCAGLHDLWRDRREVLDLSGRKHPAAPRAGARTPRCAGGFIKHITGRRGWKRENEDVDAGENEVPQTTERAPLGHSVAWRTTRPLA